MTTVLCSAASGGYQQLLKLAAPSMERYAERHGFDLLLDNGFECARPPSWHKIILIERLLAVYDTVIWVDADAKFHRVEPNILDVCPPTRKMWMAKHRIPGHRLLPNCGVMVCHRDKQLSKFFNAIWGETFYIDHPWWEQAAILSLLGYEIERPGAFANPPDEGKVTSWTPLVGFFGNVWNSMPCDPHPDPVIEHWSGIPFPDRLTAMGG